MAIGELGVCFLPALPLVGPEPELELEIVTVLPQTLQDNNAPRILMIRQILKLAMSGIVQVSFYEKKQS
jgi:hypothetical protein